MDLAALAVVALIVGFASFGQTVAGFGFSLLAVAPLTLVVDPKDAVAIAAVLLVASSGLVVLGERRHIEWTAVRPIMVGAVPGLPLGLVVLDAISDDTLRVGLAIAIFCTVALLLSGLTLQTRSSALEVGAGFLTGLLTTSLNTNGPPTVLALQARRLEPEAFRPTTSAVLGLTSAVGAVLFAAAGRLHSSVLAAIAVSVPTMLLGWILGTRARYHVPAERFRQGVLGLLLIAGCATLAAAIG